MIDHTSYTIPELIEGSNRWYIKYYYRNPASSKLERFRPTYNLNRIKRISDRRKRGKLLCKQLYQNLLSGFNPFQEVDALGSLNAVEAFEKAVQIKAKLLREKNENRTVKRGKRSKRKPSYQSRMKIFKDWLLEHFGGLAIAELSPAILQMFFDHLLEDRGVVANTRIGYWTTLNVMIEILLKRGYLLENPLKKLDKIKKQKANRKSFTAIEVQEIKRYLEKTDRDLLFCVQTIYALCIRTQELVTLKVSDFDLDSDLVFIPVHKTDKFSPRVLPSWYKSALEKRIKGAKESSFIVGRGLEVNEKQCYQERIQERHKAALEELNLYQRGKTPYSWKDTSVDKMMENGVPLKWIQDQCGHERIETTMIYEKRQLKVNWDLREKQPSF